MPPSKPVKSYLPRKLLVAALGVATINYVGTVACGGKTDGTSGSAGEYPPDYRPDYPPTSGNLPNPPPTSGNLMAPVDSGVADAPSDDAESDASDAGTDGASDAASE